MTDERPMWWARPGPWLAAAYVVHLLGFVAFWLTWNAAFGTTGRMIPAALDIPLAYTELLVTGIGATILTTRSVRAGPSLWLAAPQCLSFFMAFTWIWSVLLIEGIV